MGKEIYIVCSRMLGNFVWRGDLLHRYFCKYFIGLFMVLSLTYCYTITINIFYSILFPQTFPDIDQSKNSPHKTFFSFTEIGLLALVLELPNFLWFCKEICGFICV